VGNAADAAKKGGVKHIVMLSSASVRDENPTQIGRWHIDGEAKVKASGIPWTMLQPGAFASNTLQWVGSIKASGAVFLPMGEGKMTPIDPHDIADVAVKVLTEPDHEGKSYELSGPESLTTAEQLAKISAAIGKPLKYVDVTPEAAREGMAKAGMPEVFINAMLEISARVREGQGWDANETVEQLLGRKARPYEDWLSRNVAAFQ
jgi:uncharacterized protein YbjT (DUF2867 family)